VELELEFGLLGADAAREYASLRPDTPDTEVVRRLAAGHRCVVARHAGRLVAVRWVSTGRAEVDYLGVTVPLAARVAYQYDSFTAPEVRRRGVNRALGGFLDDVLEQDGFTTLVNTLLPENAGGYALAREVVMPLGIIASLRLGRRAWIVRRPQSEYVADRPQPRAVRIPSSA
jgi:GNAT superfamily N-acetyltransferase